MAVASCLEARRRVGIGLEAYPGLDQHLQRRGHLHARDRGAGAKMRSGAEGQMPVRPAVEAHLLGSVEHGRIVIGRAEAERDDIAGFDVAAVQAHIARGVAAENLDRRGMAQELLDGERNRCGVGQPRQLVRVAGDPLQHQGQRVGGGFEPGAEDHGQERTDLDVVEPLAVDFG